MITRILSVIVLIPFVLITIFLAPRPLFLLIVDLILLIGLLEFFRLLGSNKFNKSSPTIIFCLFLPWIWQGETSIVLSYLLLTSLVLLTGSLFNIVNPRESLTCLSVNLLALFYLGLPLAVLSEYQSKPLELVMVLATIWSCDIAAYLFGYRWGRHKITPRLSPNKSLEGFMAGLFAAMATTLAFGHGLLTGFSWGQLILMGLVLGMSAILGDLFESLLKRSVIAKDSGTLIPGHGGLLDRIDSLLFALPAHHCLVLLLK